MRKQFIWFSFAVVCLMTFPFDAAGQKPRASVSAAEVNGSYRMSFGGKFKRQSNDIKILALGRSRLRISMDLVFPYTLKDGELMVNMGGLDGEATLKGDTAIYRSGKCEITIRFVKPGTIKVSQEGTDADCGFGHNVMSDGTYRKVSSKRPKF